MRAALSYLARRALHLFGWTVVGQPPDTPKFVLIAAPHTSNWDLLIMLLVAATFRVRLRWFGKAELFRPPGGWVMKALGGVPVNRSQRNNLVQVMAQRFRQEENFVLALPPEGTRKKAPHWKTGFYHIACEAQVPIVCGFIDYGQKETGIGPVLMPTGDIDTDMEVFRTFYENIRGKYPAQVGAIRATSPRTAEIP